MKMSKLSDIQIFKENMTSLKETSVDSHSGVNIYMTESELQVISFDSVKDQYIKRLRLSETPKSNDALYLSCDHDFIFIEFKNGYMDNDKTHGVRKKIYDSILIFSDITNVMISQLRKKMIYILVYNEDANKDHKDVKEKNKNRSMSSSRAFTDFSKLMRKHSNEEYIMFGVNKFKGYCFKDVHTYSKKEFEEYLKKLNA